MMGAAIAPDAPESMRRREMGRGAKWDDPKIFLIDDLRRLGIH